MDVNCAIIAVLYHTVGVIYAGQKIYANLLKLPTTKFMREIFMRFKKKKIIGGCLTYVLKFISNFNYANFLSLA